jgi:hypothetical protein
MTRQTTRRVLVAAMLGFAVLCMVVLLFLAKQRRQARPATRLPPPPVNARALAPDSSLDTPSGRPSHNAAAAQLQKAPQSPTVETPQGLASFIRQYSAGGGKAVNLYGAIAAMRLPERSWWRKGDLAALLALATDASVDASIRAVVMRLYLAGAADAELKANADLIQNTAIAETDDMAAAVLQGMAERSVSPAILIKHTLNAGGRSVPAKCHAWYAARLTEKGNSEYAALALAASDNGLTEASKVAFDYLAAGSFAEEVSSAPALRAKVKSLTTAVASLPAAAGPIDVANGDALIRAIPHVTGTDDATATLLVMVEEAANPEMRLSALEQLVGIHLGGEKDLSQDLRDIRNTIATLFQDPAAQLRAKVRLNRADQPATR